MSNEKVLPVALSYIGGASHEWYLAQAKNGTEFSTLQDTLDGLETRFRLVNKEKLACDMLSKWKPMKDVQKENEDFLKIILDITNIGMEEQVDRYTRGLNNFISKELCTKEYKSVTDAMKDTERVESVYRKEGSSRFGRSACAH